MWCCVHERSLSDHIIETPRQNSLHCLIYCWEYNTRYINPLKKKIMSTLRSTLSWPLPDRKTLCISLLVISVILPVHVSSSQGNKLNLYTSVDLSSKISEQLRMAHQYKFLDQQNIHFRPYTGLPLVSDDIKNMNNNNNNNRNTTRTKVQKA